MLLKSLDRIKIFPDFLDDETIKTVINLTLEGKEWKFGHRSNGNNEYTSPFWYMELEENEFFTEKIKKIIEQKTKQRFKINRVYANGQTFGQDGSFHQDDQNENAYTFCLYVTPLKNSPEDIIGGELQFKLPDLNDNFFEYNIIYNFNQGVLFPSNYYHRGMSFKRYTHELRVCVAWKLEIIDDDNISTDLEQLD